MNKLRKYVLNNERFFSESDLDEIFNQVNDSITSKKSVNSIVKEIAELSISANFNGNHKLSKKLSSYIPYEIQNKIELRRSDRDHKVQKFMMEKHPNAELYLSIHEQMTKIKEIIKDPNIGIQEKSDNIGERIRCGYYDFTIEQIIELMEYSRDSKHDERYILENLIGGICNPEQRPSVQAHFRTPDGNPYDFNRPLFSQYLAVSRYI